MMPIGTKIIWLQTSVEDSSLRIVAEGTITKVGKETYWVDNKHKAEDQVYQAFCLPDREDTRAWCESQIEVTARHKRENDAIAIAFYKLRNKLINEGAL